MVADFSKNQEPVSLPAPDNFDWHEAAFHKDTWPYTVVHEKGETPADTEEQAMGILRTVSRAQIGMWYLLNRAGKQWRRARWTVENWIWSYRVEEIRNGKIQYHSEVVICDRDDIGI